MLRPHPSAPNYRADLDAIGDAVEAAARRREEAARKARGSLTRRVLGAARRNVMQVVPVVVIAALFGAGLVIRSQQVPTAGVVVAGVVALGGYWWRWGIAADRPALAMLRPTLAVAYLVASAVTA